MHDDLTEEIAFMRQRLRYLVEVDFLKRASIEADEEDLQQTMMQLEKLKEEFRSVSDRQNFARKTQNFRDWEVV